MESDSDSDGESWLVNFKWTHPEEGLPDEIRLAIRNNHAPPKATVRSALALRDEPATAVPQFYAKLATLDAEIHELEKQKSVLQLEAEPHRRKLEACNTLLAPIRRVPFDIIREIARLTLPYQPAANVKNAPLSLCQVSSAWRKAALSLPELWTTLYLVVEDLLSTRRYHQRVVEWFERARGRPVSLYLCFSFQRPHVGSAKHAYGRFLHKLRPSVPQIRHLRIVSKSLKDALPCFENAHWPLDGLESLELHGHDSESMEWMMEDTMDGPQVPFPAMTLFKTATNLRSLTVENDFYFTLGAPELIPWAQLTTVRMTEWLRVADWVKIMKSCPQLRLGQFEVGAEWVDEGTRPVLAHLEELRLHGMHFEVSMFDLISIFDLPNLRVIDVCHLTMGFADDIPDPLPANQIPALKTIHNFYFNDFWSKTHPMYVLELITEMTNLRELELTDVMPGTAYQAVFERMLFDEPTPILPNLSRLFVKADKKVKDWTAFIDMVASRSFNTPVGCSPLKVVAVVIEQAWTKRSCKVIPALAKLKEALKGCQEAGLSIMIGDHHNGVYSCRPPCVSLGWNPRWRD
ncbi:unnamed protein product [Cyclocybe aegerita]|uniref:F-box domain-containing protein n=1 Tax=Cyclocybe aegerita TaxID=1973307 RepID=A0A8S0WIH8_CYCAE|nr:unnamed protein product [Cyclocybe aegerita]